MLEWKVTREDGTDYYSGTVNYFTKDKFVHPNPDLNNKSACGVGFHLAKNIITAINYTHQEGYIIQFKGINKIGEDKTKARFIELQKLKVYKPNWKEIKPLWDEYKKKKKPFLDEYEEKIKPLWDEYKEKEKLLLDEYNKIILECCKVV